MRADSLQTRRFPVRSAMALALVLGAISAPGAVFNIANGDVAGLIAAINAANTNAQDDTINLAANGSYILTAVHSGRNGLPQIVTDDSAAGRGLTINGNNATIARSSAAGTTEFRILDIDANFQPGVTISNTTLENGRLSGDDNDNGLAGGAVYAENYVTLNNCTIRNNRANRSGGVEAIGVVYLNGCTLINNVATGRLFGGGAIGNEGFARLTNCTFSGNTAPNSQGPQSSLSALASPTRPRSFIIAPSREARFFSQPTHGSNWATPSSSIARSKIRLELQVIRASSSPKAST